MEPTYSDLDESTEQFVAECLRALQEIQVDISDAKAIGIYYDQMLAEWLAAPENERSDPYSRINLIGVALGQHLVQFTPMKWVIATDDLGVELAVRGSGWLVYPPNAVAKRWDEREGGAFIPTFAREIISLTIPT